MLPKNDFSIFTLKIPSTGKVIEYRQFLRKEQKVLLIAAQSGEEEDILRAVKQIIQNCIISDINIDNLTIFDLEYIILKIRSKSVNNIAELICTCQNCETDNKLTIDLDSLEMEDVTKIDKKIKLSDTLGICMKFPTTKSFSSKDLKENDLLISCVDYIYDDTNIYKDFTQEELIEFMDTLSIQQSDLISKWIENIPHLEYKTILKCAHCKQDIPIVIDTFDNFF